MSKNLTEVDTFTANVTVPEDGIDLRSAATVETPFQALANRATYLKARHDAALVQVLMPLDLGRDVVDYDGSVFTLTGSGALVSGVYFDQDNVSGQGHIIAALPRLPFGKYTLTSVSAAVSGNGAGVSHTALPASGDLPELEVYEEDLDPVSGVPTITSLSPSPVEYAPGTLANYDKYQRNLFSITLTTPLTLTYKGASTNFLRHYVVVRGEKGANAKAGALRLYGLTAAYTITEL